MELRILRCRFCSGQIQFYLQLKIIKIIFWTIFNWYYISIHKKHFPISKPGVKAIKSQSNLVPLAGRVTRLKDTTTWRAAAKAALPDNIRRAPPAPIALQTLTPLAAGSSVGLAHLGLYTTKPLNAVRTAPTANSHRSTGGLARFAPETDILCRTALRVHRVRRTPNSTRRAANAKSARPARCRRQTRPAVRFALPESIRSAAGSSVERVGRWRRGEQMAWRVRYVTEFFPMIRCLVVFRYLSY